METDDRIPALKRERVIERIDATLASLPNAGQDSEHTIDRATFAAWQRLSESSVRASGALDSMIEKSSRTLKCDEQQMREFFTAWRRASEPPYVQMDDPQHPHLSEFRPDHPDLPTDKATQTALDRLAWEQYLRSPAPVFVYGTLRSGQGNAVLLEGGHSHKAQAELRGIALHSSPYAGFPLGTDDSDSVAQGEVVFLTDTPAGERVRSQLDRLEGFHAYYPEGSLYVRSLRNARVPGENGEARDVQAWVYVISRRTLASERLSEATKIASGDWLEHRKKAQFGR